MKKLLVLAAASLFILATVIGCSSSGTSASGSTPGTTSSSASGTK